VQARAVNDAQAAALAYHTVQQQLSLHKLKLEELSRHNGMLELQQALDRKELEAGRLYLLLLFTVLLSVAFWLVRTKRSQLKFQKLACFDSLTGILNHQHFVWEAEQALRYAEKSARHVCVVVIDLDHFKRINDTYGHAVGDAVLIRIVALCQAHLRSIDVFGRLGGEEFGLVLPECALGDAMQIVERIRAAIAATPFHERIIEGAISASFGLASTDAGGYVLPALMAKADAALYRAKHRGRNRVEMHAEDAGFVPA
jgi:diguanylate cyclase (GGDEF)-like protein